MDTPLHKAKKVQLRKHFINKKSKYVIVSICNLPPTPAVELFGSAIWLTQRDQSVEADFGRFFWFPLPLTSMRSHYQMLIPP